MRQELLRVFNRKSLACDDERGVCQFHRNALKDQSLLWMHPILERSKQLNIYIILKVNSEGNVKPVKFPPIFVSLVVAIVYSSPYSCVWNASVFLHFARVEPMANTKDDDRPRVVHRDPVYTLHAEKKTA
jgi:hypothetical protein